MFWRMRFVVVRSLPLEVGSLVLISLHLSNRRNQTGTLHETENVRTGSDRRRLKPARLSKAQGCWLSGPFLVSPKAFVGV